MNYGTGELSVDSEEGFLVEEQDSRLAKEDSVNY